MRRVSLFIGLIIPLCWICSCSDDPEIKPESEHKVTITTDKTIIKANNKDEVVFTVTVDGQVITSSVTITQKGGNTPVEGLHFSTDSAASYTFYATYNNIKSNEISIEAVDIELIITADKQTIKANSKDKVTFTVSVDGEDVTAAATVFQVESVTSTALTDSGFSTKIPGTYTFYAIRDGKKSNEITIEATALTITLSVDKTSIKANNSDKAIFTVKADDEIVTAEAMIMQLNNSDDEVIDGWEFMTDEAANYTFYAIYEDGKSNEVSVEATYVALNFLKGFSIVEIISNACPYCPLLVEEVNKFQRTMPDQIHVIALHPHSKYCTSELSGALDQTAVDFADRVNASPSPPPLAVVDLYEAVHLHAINTQKFLSDAINKVNLQRERVSVTGIAVQSSVNDGLIAFDVKIKTIKTDTYRFFAFIVEDGIVHRQAIGNSTADPNYVHNNVATYQLSEGEPFMGVSLGTVSPNHETIRSFTIDTRKIDAGRYVNLDNCRIVCYTLRTNDGRNYLIDNVTSCPVNGSVRYLYEK